MTKLGTFVGKASVTADDGNWATVAWFAPFIASKGALTQAE